MAKKKIYEIKEFSGGLNCYGDARDIKENEFSQNWNIIVDKTGILRVVGNAVDHKNARMLTNTGFNPGFGLFQFTSDYSWNNFETGFDVGVESGTVAAVAGGAETTTFLLEDTPSVQAITNYYNGMTIFFYSATNNAGKSRVISATSDVRTVSVSPAFDDDVTTSDKYIIYKWKSVNWNSTTSSTEEEDYITDGSTTGHFSSDFTPSPLSGDLDDSENNYFVVDKITATNNSTTDGGYLQYSGTSDSGVITLKAGVEYTLSFYCALAHPYMNFVSDGANDGSSNNSEQVPWIQLHSPTVTNGTNIGLYLLDQNTWIEKSTQAGYITNIDANYIVNGDFEAGTDEDFTDSSAWRVVGTNVFGDPLAEVVETAVSPDAFNYVYGLEGKSAELIIADTTNGVPDGYIYQEMTLYTGVSYHLNFVHTGTGLKYAIKDGDSYIIPWRSDGTGHTKYIGDAYVDTEVFNKFMWKYPFQSHVPPFDNWGSSNYIRFTVPKDPDSATKTITLCFTALGSASGISGQGSTIDGVSVTRAHNDLVTMNFSDNENSSVSPLGTTWQWPGVAGALGNSSGQNIQNWHKYSMKFMIPYDYNDASDWILRLHAGRWGWQENAKNSTHNLKSTEDLEDASFANQEIYIDNISLEGYAGSSKSGAKDTITLLQSSDATSTDIAINSSSSGDRWDTGFLKFKNGTAEPVFDYINGVLRISDGNFDNSNKNLMLYYDNYPRAKLLDSVSWRKREGYLQEPSNIFVKALVGDEEEQNVNPISGVVYDAIPYINTFCSGITYRTPYDDEGGTGGTVNQETGWRYDQFGPDGGVTGRGIISRHICGANMNNYQDAGSIEKHIIENGVDSYLASYTDSNLHAASAGYLGVTELVDGDNGDDEDYAFTGGHVDDWYSNALTPLLIPINLSDAETYIASFGDVVIQSAKKIKEVTFSITFKMRTFNRANSNWDGTISDSDKKWIHNYSPPSFLGGVHRVESRISNNDVQADINSATDGLIFEEQVSTGGWVGGDLWNRAGSLTNNFKYGNGGSIGGRTMSTVYANPDSYNMGGTHGNATITTLNTSIGNNTDWADLEFTVTDTIAFQYANAPEINSDSIVIYIKENFDGGSGGDGGADSVWGCFDSPIWGRITTGESPDNDYSGYKHNVLRAWSKGNTEEGEWSPAPTPTHDGYQLIGFTGTDRPESSIQQSQVIPWRNYSFWTSWKVNEVKLKFHDEFDFVEGGYVPVTISNGLQVDFLFAEHEVVGSGWEERTFQIATSNVNSFGEESSLKIAEQTIGPFNVGFSPNITVYVTNELYSNTFIEKTKVYLKSTESDTWYLQFYIDNIKRTMYSTTSGGASVVTDYEAPQYNEAGEVQTYIWYKKYEMLREFFPNFNEVNSYESETFVRQEDGLSNNTLTCRYKTSVVANNRLYVGNIKQADNVYEDRMLKSVVNKYGVIPASNFIDVAINDGDEITALAYYKDKILQFKKNKIFVIDISGDYEFLQDTFHNVGVHGQFSVINTPYGVSWANNKGFYIYDGEKLTNLIDKKIPTSQSYENPGLGNNYWCVSSDTGDCVVGYDRKRDTALINWSKTEHTSTATPSGATFNFATNSWAFVLNTWNDATTGSASDKGKMGNLSNMITDKDDNILFYQISTAANDISNGINSLRKWEHEAVSTTQASKLTYFTTKDITFGDINVRKKLYRVYVTYRVRTNGIDSGCVITGAINGSGSFTVDFLQTSKFAFGESNSSGKTCYTGGHLDETDGIWKTAELKFDTPSQVNNITSFQLQFIGNTAPFDFEINDISISYRVKGIK